MLRTAVPLVQSKDKEVSSRENHYKVLAEKWLGAAISAQNFDKKSSQLTLEASVGSRNLAKVHPNEQNNWFNHNYCVFKVLKSYKKVLIIVYILTGERYAAKRGSEAKAGQKVTSCNCSQPGQMSPHE